MSAQVIPWQTCGLQTGWTGIVASMMHVFATTTTPEQALEAGKMAAVVEVEKPKTRRQKTLVVETKQV